MRTCEAARRRYRDDVRSVCRKVHAPYSTGKCGLNNGLSAMRDDVRHARRSRHDVLRDRGQHEHADVQTPAIHSPGQQRPRRGRGRIQEGSAELVGLGAPLSLFMPSVTLPPVRRSHWHTWRSLRIRRAKLSPPAGRPTPVALTTRRRDLALRRAPPMRIALLRNGAGAPHALSPWARQ